MSNEGQEQPTNRQILDAVLHSQDVLAIAVGRIERRLGTVEGDVGTLKTDVGTLKSDVREIKRDLYRVEKRVIRIDDRVANIENINIGPLFADHERRISRLEGLN